MFAGGFGEGLADKGDRQEEPAERVASPLSQGQYVLCGDSQRLLTASGCFHGHDKLLSMAPSVISGVGPFCIGVVERLDALMGSLRPYGSSPDIDCRVYWLGASSPSSCSSLFSFGGSATIVASWVFWSILIIQLSSPLSVLRMM